MAPSSMLKSAILILTCAITRALSIVTLDKEAMTTNECDADTPMVVPNFKANWFKATEYCHYLGRNLVMLGSAEKQAIVAKVIEATDKVGDNSFWIGGSDLAELGNFHWHSTGTRIVWQNWNELVDAPTAGDSRRNDRCVLLGMPDGLKWIVVNCWDEYYFLCERPIFEK
ncbi:uncharacterized protein LOC134216304 [Armigeres subalbatus]|uniref:uncharacterized protein LOC134216304 n=1 Tax=Armigeres subalbatus TaxID=124917 RepID=UPI002ED3065F